MYTVEMVMGCFSARAVLGLCAGLREMWSSVKVRGVCPTYWLKHLVIVLAVLEVTIAHLQVSRQHIEGYGAVVWYSTTLLIIIIGRVVV